MNRRFAAVAAITVAVAAQAGCAALTSAGPNPGVPAPPASHGRTAVPEFPVARLLRPAGAKYLGVFPDSRPGSLTAVRRFAASVGATPDIIGAYVAWGTPFDPRAVARNWSYGALSYLSWEPFRTTLRAIAAGRSDGYIAAFASAVRALGLPVAISFGHEMNGNWYPWGTGQATPGQFVRAWRRIHAQFQAAGADNVIWVWNPNVVGATPQVRLRPYYPGDAEVDWVGITGYFPAAGPQTFAALFQATIHQIRTFAHKPVIIAETSVQPGPAEAACARALVTALRRRSRLLGFIWFDFDKGGVDWRIEPRPDVRQAVARGLSAIRLVGVR